MAAVMCYEPKASKAQFLPLNFEDSIEEVPEKKMAPDALPGCPCEAKLPNPKAADFENDDDATLLARLIFGEARGESRSFKSEVAYSVLNRTGKDKWWGNSLREVIFCPGAYLSFTDINRAKMLDPLAYEDEEVWKECFEVAQEVLQNPKPTNRATHFCGALSLPHWAYLDKEETLPRKPSLVLTKTNGGKINFYELEK
jgi:spore germination cell wall hydrolase CwlJ-like protein